MARERLCGNPLCGRPFTPARVDAFYCGSTCRGDGTRLRELIATSPKVAAMLRAALHKREQRSRGAGKRPDTAYTIWASSASGMALAMIGFSIAHTREEAIVEAANGRAYDVSRFVAIPLRSLRPYDRDGEPLGEPPPPPSR